METNFCLFCASPCSPTFTIVDGEITRLKCERGDDHEDLHPPPSTPFFLDEENPPLLGEQLKTIFILKTILGIKEETLCSFLGKLEGQLHPEFWLQVCSACGESVREYYKILKEVHKLQKKLTVISTELKTSILETAHKNDDGVGFAAQVWKEVRAEVLTKGMEDAQVYPTPPSSAKLGKVLKTIPEQQIKSEEIVVDVKPELFITGDILAADDNDANVEVPIETTAKPEVWIVSSCGQYATFKTTSLKMEYKCLSGCSAKFNTLYSMEKHIRDLRSVCEVCGALVHKTDLLLHLKGYHPSSKGAIKRQKVQAEVMVEDNEHFSKISRGTNLFWFRCKGCPLQFTLYEQIVTHLELHKEGSGAVTCGICKWALWPDRLQLHNQNYHPNVVGLGKAD